jgi:membrane complex biogenesis BtpA family protein
MSDAPAVARERGNALMEIFGRADGVLIGVVHLLPLPGAPDHRGSEVEPIYDRALADARAYAAAGFDGLIVENHGDIPFAKPDDIGPETAAHYAVASDRIRRMTSLPIGVNVLANAALHALAIASAVGARFVRVNQWANAYVANEGLIEGAAARATRYRRELGAHDVHIFADAQLKHGAHAIVQDRPIHELVRDVEFFNADAVIATGQRTGHAADLDYIKAIKAATSLPTLVGSGVTPDNVGDILAIVDGVIVASALKIEGRWRNAVDPERAERFAHRRGAGDSATGNLTASTAPSWFQTGPAHRLNASSPPLRASAIVNLKTSPRRHAASTQRRPLIAAHGLGATRWLVPQLQFARRIRFPRSEAQTNRRSTKNFRREQIAAVDDKQQVFGR